MLKAFWPCSLTSPFLKDVYNFWKFQGLIDGFNESRSQIDSGGGKMADESMSAIRFCTTTK